MTTLLMAEHDNQTLSEHTAKALTAAQKMGPVDILVMGDQCESVAEQACLLQGVGKVLVAQHPDLAHQLAETTAQVLLACGQGYSAIVAAATTTGKNTLPRVAAKLDVMQISEVIEVLGSDTFKRPIFAGNGIQTMTSNDPVKVLTVRTSNFEAAGKGAACSIEHLSVTLKTGHSVHLSDQLSESDRPELSSAKKVISGGRALGSAENFQTFILPVADKLGSAVGASRAAVDSGFAPNDWQVGQTGKVVSPDLYIACGISGAIQHLAGMKDSKVIVAINNDEDAPIFQVADYRLQEDLFKALPELSAKL